MTAAVSTMLGAYSGAFSDGGNREGRDGRAAVRFSQASAHEEIPDSTPRPPAPGPAVTLPPDDAGIDHSSSSRCGPASGNRMSAPRNILVVFGTRPEAIKLAPVIQRLRREPDSFRVAVCATAQHREMLDQVTGLFGIVPDIDLDLMRPDQALNELAARSFEALDRVLRERAADWLLVQGDTTTALCAGLAAFHRRIPVAHVEAGLRTGDLSRPFPEEMNRRVVDLVAAAAFAPTARAATALASEGVPMGRIHVTGNTVVDALLQIASRQGSVPEENVVLITA